MNNNPVGFRFNPTDEELINHYLKNYLMNKILGKPWLVDAISEINICSYDPVMLPSLSKIKSNDHVWYFFSPKGKKRATCSGYWKVTGVALKILEKRGNRSEIGAKKVLVYYEGRGVTPTWVMHEYQISCLPPHQRTHVICKVMYKGKDEDFPSCGNNSSQLCLPKKNSSQLSHSLVSDSSTFRATTLTEMGKLEENIPSVERPVFDSNTDSSTVRATTLTEMGKLEENTPSVQRPVFDSNTVREATLAKMYKLLQNLPSVEIHGKLNSHGAPYHQNKRS